MCVYPHSAGSPKILDQLRSNPALGILGRMKRSIEYNALFRQEAFDQAYMWAVELLAKETIDMGKFYDRYSRKEVEKDRQEAERLILKYAQKRSPEEEQAKRFATIFEATIHEQVELSDWLGPDVRTIKVTSYDDLKNKVDTIAEIVHEKTETSHLALAIDVTFSPAIEKKFSSILDGIKSGRCATIKYFLSEDTESGEMDVPSSLTNVPRVVIGAEIRVVRELANLRMDGKKKELGKHAVQWTVLDELKMQCVVFGRYARTQGKTEIAAKYDALATVIEGIRKEKEKKITPEFREDSVFSAMKRYLEDVESGL